MSCATPREEKIVDFYYLLIIPLINVDEENTHAKFKTMKIREETLGCNLCLSFERPEE